MRISRLNGSLCHMGSVSGPFFFRWFLIIELSLLAYAANKILHKFSSMCSVMFARPETWEDFAWCDDVCIWYNVTNTDNHGTEVALVLCRFLCLIAFNTVAASLIKLYCQQEVWVCRFRVGWVIFWLTLIYSLYLYKRYHQYVQQRINIINSLLMLS